MINTVSVIKRTDDVDYLLLELSLQYSPFGIFQRFWLWFSSNNVLSVFEPFVPVIIVRLELIGGEQVDLSAALKPVSMDGICYLAFFFAASPHPWDSGKLKDNKEANGDIDNKI